MSLNAYTKAGADTAIAAAVATETTRAEGAEGTLTTAMASKADLVSGKIPTSQLPALATFEKVTVADATARKALTSSQIQPGDIAIQTDDGSAWMLIDTPTSTDASWHVLPTSVAGTVLTVNGQSGTVVLGASDVGADASGAAAAAQTAAESYIDGKIAAEVTRANGAYSKVTDNGDGTFTAT